MSKKKPNPTCGEILRAELVEELAQAAMKILHHDADRDKDKEALWELEQLREAFTKILEGTP